ncbi:MAG: flavodoxin [Clostridia bacterium]|nr:flavodoxin [Lachnospiraceae bacterium]NCB99125.1 flavodoxin [Clostridia bacterium]NCD02181.1 flavodoxin [Clostridia bacterium]
MKKITSLLLIAAFSFSLVACGSRQEANSKTTESENVTTEEKPTETTETAEESDAEETNDTLVVYFSNTGNTKAIAEKIANGLDADIYEIIAEVPYTDADLDYNDNNSRSTQEMNDPSARPAISGSVENMEQYDTIYIGYPIWWGEAPRILDTFVELYDFTDKTVIPFCTSASSGMGSSASGLESLAGSGNWLDGQRFSGSESDETVMEWVNGL